MHPRALLWTLLACCGAGVGTAQEAAPGGKPAADLPALLPLFDNDAREEAQRTMRFGLVLPHAKDRTTLSGYKQLTYHPRGLTGNVCVKVDGKERLFGEPPGKWAVLAEPLAGGKGAGSRLGVRSVWESPEGVRVTQAVEVVVNPLTGRRDTCRVGYRVENQDEAPHAVGLRCLIDTLAGGNDGAPFLLPGRPEPCDDKCEFAAAAVPPYVFALERGDLQDPGVAAQLTLAPEPGQEKPARLTLGGWPDKRSGVEGADDGKTLWSVPVLSLRRTDDAAATVYWPEAKMLSGAVRDVGYRYGLARFTGGKGGDTGLLLAGTPRAGRELTAVAVVRRAGKDRSVTLEVPEGARTVGPATRVVQAGRDGEVAVVTWKFRPPRPGTFPVLLRADGNVSQELQIAVGAAGN